MQHLSQRHFTSAPRLGQIETSESLLQFLHRLCYSVNLCQQRMTGGEYEDSIDAGRKPSGRVCLLRSASQL
jgi:hypothetical protein